LNIKPLCARNDKVAIKEPMMKPYGDCVYCGGAVVERPQRVDYRIHGQLYILENVPTGVCSQCGEQFFKAEVVKEMEAAVQTATGSAPTIRVPVIAMK